MERIQSTQESGDDSDSVDAFTSVMGPEHPGRVRLYGRGVNKTILKKKKRDFGSSVNATDERMEQKMEEMEERMQQKLLEKLNAQKDARAPGEAAFAQQGAIQPINRPSAGSNNQGGVDEARKDALFCRWSR